jgi:hypothetical protein
MTVGVNRRLNPPSGPALEKKTKTNKPMMTVGTLKKVCIKLVKNLLPGNLLR